MSQVRLNVHVVLTCTLNARLRSWVRSFPPLVQYCTLDQYAAWVPEALTAVASHLLTPELTELERTEMVQELVDNALVKGRHSKGWTLQEAHKALSDTTQALYQSAHRAAESNRGADGSIITVAPSPATHAIFSVIAGGRSGIGR